MRLCRRAPRTAFVLSGGGMLGALQVGQLRALTEAGVRPDLIVGCSVGAINGAQFAADPTPEGVDRLAGVWTRLAASDLFPGSRVRRAWNLLRKGESLYPNAGIRTLSEQIPAASFDDLEVSLRIVAANLRTGKERVFDTGSLTDAILASTAMPGVFAPVVLDGESFVDGGVVNNVPISVAVEAGTKTVYVLNCLPPVRENHRQIRRPIDVMVQAYTQARSHRVKADLERYAEDARIVLFPVPETGVRFDDNSQAGDLIDLGYEVARSYMGHPSNGSARRRVPIPIPSFALRRHNA